jgi:hypothetical protein
MTHSVAFIGASGYAGARPLHLIATRSSQCIAAPSASRLIPATAHTLGRA